MRWAVVSMLAAGCSAPDAPRELVVVAVAPDAATSEAPVPVRIEGDGFELPIVSDIDDGENSVGSYAVSVGGVSLEDTAWRGFALIEGTLPAGLPVGPHDVVVTIGDRSATLIDGYVVLDVTQPLVCPAGYDLMLPSSTSRYRVITTAAPFASHNTTCNADAPGTTHLVSLDTATELLELKAALVAANQPLTNHYIGAAQRPDQATVVDGWLSFNGGPLPALWSAGQPNDDLAGESNEENLAALNLNDQLNDVTGDLSYPAVCECDGVPIDPAVAALLPP